MLPYKQWDNGEQTYMCYTGQYTLHIDYWYIGEFFLATVTSSLLQGPSGFFLWLYKAFEMLLVVI